MLGLAGCLTTVKPPAQALLPDQAGPVPPFEAPPARLPLFTLPHLASRAALSAGLRQVLLLLQLQAAALPDDPGTNDMRAGPNGRRNC